MTNKKRIVSLSVLLAISLCAGGATVSAAEAVSRAQWKEMAAEAAARFEFRSTEEAKRTVEILERLKTLGKVAPKAN